MPLPQPHLTFAVFGTSFPAPIANECNKKCALIMYRVRDPSPKRGALRLSSKPCRLAGSTPKNELKRITDSYSTYRFTQMTTKKLRKEAAAEEASAAEATGAATGLQNPVLRNRPGDIRTNHHKRDRNNL